MIRKDADGKYHVQSESGRDLGGPYKTKSEAEKRLRQVEYFKQHTAHRERSESGHGAAHERGETAQQERAEHSKTKKK